MDQKTYRLTAPSKTFLMGEYAVLKGGAGLLLNTEPRFELLVTRRVDSQSIKVSGIHPQSPAGVLMQDLAMFFSAWQVTFLDPHSGRGGFGASSSQFLLLYSFFQWAMQNVEVVQKEFGQDIVNYSTAEIFEKSNLLADAIELTINSKRNVNFLDNPHLESQKLLEVYRTYAWGGNGLAPSGMDLISQNTGHLAFVKADGTTKVFAWPFHHLEFVLLHTGKKQTTHSHLANLQDSSFEELMGITEQTYSALVEKDEEVFVEKLQKFQDMLLEKLLVSPYTQNILMYLQERDEVLVAKGCGALGADVIMVILMKDLAEEFVSWVQESQPGWGLESPLTIVAQSENLSTGVKFEVFEHDDSFLQSIMRGVGMYEVQS